MPTQLLTDIHLMCIHGKGYVEITHCMFNFLIDEIQASSSCTYLLSRYEIRGKKEAAFDILVTKCSGQSLPLTWSRGHTIWITLDFKDSDAQR